MTELAEFVDADALAQLLGVPSRRWVYRAVAEHGMPAIRVGRSVLFSTSAVCSWLESQRIGDWDDGDNKRDREAA